MELFEARGTAHVTAAHIAERAGVTERTFFRHFRTKEEAVLLIHQRFDDALMGGLPSSPDAPPQATLRDLYRGVLETFGDRSSPEASEMLRVQALAAQDPQVRLASLRRDDERAEDLVQHLIAMSSASSHDELDIRMDVEVTGAAVRVAFTRWSACAGASSLAELFDLCIESVERW